MSIVTATTAREITERSERVNSIHSLRGDLADAVSRDLATFGQARVYGPLSSMVRVWNAADRFGAVVTTTRCGHWLVTVDKENPA